MTDPGPNKGNILVFAPHPDDETLGCGGTVALRLREGFDVFVAVMTEGEKLFSAGLGIFEDPTPAEVAAARKAETIKAAGILGVKRENILFMGFPDAELQNQAGPAAERAADLIRVKKPVCIFGIGPYEGHPDHKAANAIVKQARVAAKSSAELWQYFVSPRHGLSMADLPDKIERVDISAALRLKDAAIACFQCHLGIISNKQSRPLWADGYGHRLKKDELFIIER